MSTPLELVQIVEQSGGRFKIDGDRLGINPKTAAAPVLEELRKHKQAIIGLILERGAAIWRRPFEQWLLSACIQRPRDFGGFNVMLIDFNLWAGLQGGSACSPDLLSWLLAERDYVIGTVHGVELVSGLLLKEDWQAHQRFQEAVSDET